ncbi:hypothetical protein INS49_013212 [Diaporthe citri]|uniref:uncharacterized protein n=1 Tax=Diaporthe citri TaxID=83186 RepID=UPI001C81CA33|nr:uncharacterized protein INS49_013212 [Diaporthe citri]KAG6359689.1 hypothetical protein INS49_013212 [Diaporthe citri]
MQFKVIILSIVTLAAGHAVAKDFSSQEDDFSGFINGEGNVVFGNEGVACTVDGEEGECNQFGSCFRLNVNEVDALAQDAPECIAGGEIGVLDEDGNVVPS